MRDQLGNEIILNLGFYQPTLSYKWQGPDLPCVEDSLLFYQVLATLVSLNKGAASWPPRCPAALTILKNSLVVTAQLNAQQLLVAEFLKWQKDLRDGDDIWIQGQNWEVKLNAQPVTLLRELSLLLLYTYFPNQARVQTKLASILSTPYSSWWLQGSSPGAGAIPVLGDVEIQMLNNLYQKIGPGVSQTVLNLYLAPLYADKAPPFDRLSSSEIIEASQNSYWGSDFAPLWFQYLYQNKSEDSANEYLIDVWQKARQVHQRQRQFNLLPFIEKIPADDLQELAPLRSWAKIQNVADKDDIFLVLQAPEVVRQLRSLWGLPVGLISSQRYEHYLSMYSQSMVPSYALFQLMALGAGAL